MADKIHLSIVTDEGVTLDRMVGYVNLPTSMGSVGVLPGHAPMLCALEKGVVRCKFGRDESLSAAIGAGIANVNDNEVTLLVAAAETNK